jgi:beta-xylosidase
VLPGDSEQSHPDDFYLVDAPGIGPSLLFDDDGHVWYTGNHNPVRRPHTAIYHSAQTGRVVQLPIGKDHPRYSGWQPG